jgi:hypothetical protein
MHAACCSCEHAADNLYCSSRPESLFAALAQYKAINGTKRFTLNKRVVWWISLFELTTSIKA